MSDIRGLGLYNLLRENFGAATGGMFFFPEPESRRYAEMDVEGSRASFSTETLDSYHVEGYSFPSAEIGHALPFDHF